MYSEKGYFQVESIQLWQLLIFPGLGEDQSKEAQELHVTPFGPYWACSMLKSMTAQLEEDQTSMICLEGLPV